MGQKTNPNIIRPINQQYQGTPKWSTPLFNHNSYCINKLIKACCKNSSIYFNKINISISYNYIYIECDMIQVFQESNKNLRKNIEKNKDYNKKIADWNHVTKRLYLSLKLIQKYTGFKKIKIKAVRKKMYTRNIPKPVRQKTHFYTKGFNLMKYSYARFGIQLLTAVMLGQATAYCLTNFMRFNIRTRSKRKKHSEFIRFLKHSIETLEPEKKIKGIKVQLKGRFGHKPKGRSKVWKYQLGLMPLSKIKATIQARYQQAQTKLGSVGIKTWIHYE